jgi:hypothetical protein
MDRGAPLIIGDAGLVGGGATNPAMRGGQTAACAR